MLTYSNAFDQVELRTQVCICGSGPAGITLATVLAKKGIESILVEGGELEYSDESQEQYEGNNAGEPYHDLDICRLRYFGGTSDHWNGLCGRLGDQDFKPKKQNPLSGWPIGWRDLASYVEVASELLELPPATAPAGLPADSDLFNPFSIALSPPTRFGSVFVEEVSKSDRILLVLNLNAIELELSEDRSVVLGLLAKGYRGETTTIRAKLYVMCLGGIENARFLLNADPKSEHGVGNQHGNVGRYFSEHPHAGVGTAYFFRKQASHFAEPSRKFVEEFDTLNFGLRVYTKDGLGAQNWMSPDSVGKNLARNVVCSVPGVGSVAEFVKGRQIECDSIAELVIASEQSLNPDSRVALSNDTDQFGKRRVSIDWRLQDIDWHTMYQAVYRYGEYLVRNDLGRVKIDERLIERHFEGYIVGGYHHMGTTRMSEAPSEGVVDKNCRVHGMRNLFIGGSSVFSSGGHINPTFTIVQLALRLADHIDLQLTNG